MRSRSTWVFWITLLVLMAWKAVMAWRLDPCYDEGYYFYWSLFPQLSYFDQPPLSAWPITLAGFLLGDSVWAIRIWPLLVGVAFALIGRLLARRVYSIQAGDLAGVLLLVIPAFAGNGLLMTPDTFLALGWAAAILFTWLALTSGTRKWLYWCLVGVAAGAGALSKYNMILFFLGLGLLWLMSPGRRWELAAGVAVSGLIALAIFSPVIVWNYQHDWISFKFQLGHGLSTKHGFWATVPQYAGDLLLVATPVLCVQAFYAAARAVRSPRWEERFLAAFLWAVAAFFGVASFRTMVQPNWAMLAFFTGAILVAGRWTEFPRWVRRLSVGFLAAIGAMAVAGLTYAAIAGNRLPVLGPAVSAPRPLRSAGTRHLARAMHKKLTLPRLAEFVGGRPLAQVVEAKEAETNAGFVCVSSYQLVGRIAFFAPSLRRRLWLPQEGHLRFPWINDRRWLGQDALIVVTSARQAAKLAPWFDRIEEAGNAESALAAMYVRPVRFYVGRGYKGRPADGTGRPGTHGRHRLRAGECTAPPR